MAVGAESPRTLEARDPKEGSSSSRTLRARDEKEEELEASSQNRGTYAAVLVQYGCCTGSFGLLVGTVAAPVVASDCCRQALMSFDCWIWVAAAVGTICYFRFLTEPQEAPEEQDKYRPLNTEEQHSSSAIATAPTPLQSAAPGPPSDISQTSATKSAEPEPEPQQPPPTCEMCIQTDPPEEPAEDSDQAQQLPPAPRTDSNEGGATGSTSRARAVGPSFRAFSAQMVTAAADFRQAAASSTLSRQVTKRMSQSNLLSGGEGGIKREAGSQAGGGADAEAPPPPRMRAWAAAVHKALPPVHEDEEAGVSTLGRNQSTQATVRPAAFVHDAEAARADSEVSTADSQQELLGRGGARPRGEQGDLKTGRCARCFCWFLMILSLLAVAAVAVAQLDPPLAQKVEKEANKDVGPAVGPTERVVRGTRSRLQTWCYSLRDWAVGLGASFGIRPARPAYVEGTEPTWHTSEWSTCSEECGTGEMRRMVYCINGETADCEERKEAPPETKLCTERRGCKWHIGQWGRCDTTCGTGVMVRQVTCQSGDCQGLTNKPPEEASCVRAHGCRWLPHPWGQCDKQCGAGKRHRHVSCENGPLESCLQHGHQPNTTEFCHSYAGCKWAPDEWTRCTNSCGNGKQSRNISCANGATAACKRIHETPRLERACHDVSGCEWKMSEWSPCSTNCGTGKQHRSVACRNGELEECLENSVLPSSVHVCHAYEGCKWTVGEWGFCNAVCGTGYRRREVVCSNGAFGDCQLGPVTTPQAAKPCVNVSGCAWSTGPWGPCSNVCGEGQQFRVVSCHNGREDACRQHREPPSNQQTCSEMSGCRLMQGGPSCRCKPRDPGMQAAGAISAVGGWVVSFAILHEMVSRAVWTGSMRQRSIALLFSPPAVLIAGIGALAASSVLNSGETLLTVKGHSAVLTSSQLTVGAIGLALWPLTLCGLGSSVWTAPKPMRCVSAVVLLAFCTLVLLTAAGSPIRPTRGTQE